MPDLTERELWLIGTYFANYDLGTPFYLQAAIFDIQFELRFQQAEDVIHSLIRKGVLSVSPDRSEIRFTQEGLRSYGAALKAQRAWGPAPGVPAAARATAQEEVRAHEGGDDAAMSPSTPDIFVSHSSQDVELASLLVQFLQSALLLRREQIRCSSVPGYRLAGGSDTDEVIRREVNGAKMLIGLLSPASLHSAYVAFELGARWGAGKPFKPLLAPGVDTNLLEGPIRSYNALTCDVTADLHQFIRELGQDLAITPEPAEAYQHHIDQLQAHRPPPAPPAAQALVSAAHEGAQAQADALKEGLLSTIHQLLTDWKTEHAADHFGVQEAEPILNRFVEALSQAHTALSLHLSDDAVRPLEGVIVDAKRLKKELQFVDPSFNYNGFWRKGEGIFAACERITTAL